MISYISRRRGSSSTNRRRFCIVLNPFGYSEPKETRA